MDITTQPLLDKEKNYLSFDRRTRKISRTNRASISKGVLVNPGENIQAAIDAVEKDGGGTITCAAGIHVVDYNITIPSFITLQGDGRDATRIDFVDQNYNITATGTAVSATTKVRNMRIKDITIERSGNTTAAVSIIYANHFILDNVRFSDNAGAGLRISASQQYTIFNCLADNNVGNGFELVGAASFTHARFTFISCIATNNTGNGFSLTTAVGALVANGAFIACEGDTNILDGFDFSGAIEVATYLTNCIANGNTENGFDLGAEFISLIACSAQDNGAIGINNTDIKNMILGCNINSNNEDFQSTSRITVIGNALNYGTGIDIKDTFFVEDDPTIAIGNIGGNTRTERRIMQMENISGATINQGSVVTFASNAEGDKVTTTTSQGHDAVFGMALYDINNNEYGAILVEGYTTLLKVDGTTDIAIGDLLGTFTTAGIAMKAATGDMAFAYALEAYTANDSNGVINALLITPRKV